MGGDDKCKGVIESGVAINPNGDIFSIIIILFIQKEECNTEEQSKAKQSKAKKRKGIKMRMFPNIESLKMIYFGSDVY